VQTIQIPKISREQLAKCQRPEKKRTVQSCGDRAAADYFGGKRNWKEKISFGNLQTPVCAAVSL